MEKDFTETCDEKDFNNSNESPDDETGVYIETHIKIFDPSTQEIFVAQRV